MAKQAVSGGQITFLLALLSLTACSSSAPVSPAPVVGMANPAAVNCVRQGGKSLPRQDASGNQYAMCQLPDGQVVEEWALYRQQHPQ